MLGKTESAKAESLLNTDGITTSIKEFIKSELAMGYAYGVKNIRYFVLASILLVVISSAALLGALLLIFGAMWHFGASVSALITTAMVLGLILIVVAGLFIFTAMSQRFWIKTFKIDTMVKEAVDKALITEASTKASTVGVTT